MESATTSDSIIKSAIIIGISAIALTLLMVVLVALIRAVQVAGERRSDRFLTTWRPLLMQNLEVVPNTFPSIAKKDVPTFLNLWLYLHESLIGSAKENLNEIARRCGMDARARRMLERGRMRDRLMAVATLGHLREKSVWHSLTSIAQSENSFLSLAAARAMIHIDPKGAIQLLMPLISTRTDWAPSRVIAILKEAGPDVITAPLVQAVLDAPPQHAPRLIRYLETIHSNYAMETIGFIVRTSKNDEVLATCLELLKDPRDLELVRALLGHPNWHVRLQVAAALGRIGTEKDGQSLIKLLRDEEWWVRYRAAQALADLPAIGLDKLRQIEREQQEPAAKEILRHVIAEREIV